MSVRILVLDVEKEYSDVHGYDGAYVLSSLGEVWSVRSGRFLTPWVNMFGYLVVKLSKNSVGEIASVHRLLAKHFIPNPENLPTVNHINKSKLDNRLDNLEWMSIEDNVKYSLKQAFKVRSPTGEIVELYGQAEFCRQHNLTQPNFSKMLNGGRRTCKGWTRANENFDI